jgi:thiosulfate/3-mercaptopyruvate sulfurtransferase
MAMRSLVCSCRSLLVTFLLGFAAFAAAQTQPVRPLLTPDELVPLLRDPGVRVLDIRPAAEYATGHLPGAVNIPYGVFRGPADNPGALPSEQTLTEALRRAGIDQNVHVIVAHAGKDATDFGAAARVYWTLKVGGLTRLSVLDGGTLGWAEDGHDLVTAEPRPEPGNFTVRFDSRRILSTEALAERLQTGSPTRLIDARPEPFFHGETRHAGAARYGTLPGAVSLPHARFFAADGKRLKPLEELRAIAAQENLIGAEPTVVFCNTGHWAATDWFVLSELLGREDVLLYPESVVAWSRRDLPMDHEPSRLQALVREAKRWVAQ